MLLYFLFFRALLYYCKTDTSVYYKGGMDTLGTAAENAECVGRVVVSTLGDAATGVV